MPFVADAQPTAAPAGRFVPDAAPTPPATFGHTLLGEGEIAGTGLVNLLPNAANSAVDLYRRITGGNTDAAPPVPTMKVGQAGQDLVRNVAGLTTPTGNTTLGEGVSHAAGAADAALGRVSPTLQDVVHQTGSVLGDVANLAPAAGAVAKIGGAATDAIDAASAAKKIVPGGPSNPINEVHAAGYQFRPSDVQARNPSMQSVPGSLRESITSSPEQTQQIVRNNSALSTRLIGEDIGVPNATKLTPEHYAQARLAPGADYDRVGTAVGTVESPAPATTETLDAMANDQSVNAMPAAARAQAARISSGLQSGKYSGPQVIQDISYFRTVPGGRAAAAALEDELGAQVASKAPELSGTYENARTQFAKIQNAEDATTGGLIDAADYRRLAEGNPRLLTGNSRLVALAGGEIPTVTALPRAGADVSPVKGTLYDTVANAAARGASKLPGLNITRPGLQAKIAAAVPATGPLPIGPYRRGLGTTLAGSPALPGDYAQ